MHEGSFQRSLPIIVGVALLTAITVSCQTLPESTAQSGAASAGVSSETWRVRLSWRTETESNAFGFLVHRGESLEGPLEILNANNPVQAAGTTTVPQQYVYYDLDMESAQTYYYRLEQIDLDGSRRIIVGEPEPLAGKSRQLTNEEVDEIRIKGTAYRESGR